MSIMRMRVERVVLLWMAGMCAFGAVGAEGAPPRGLGAESDAHRVRLTSGTAEVPRVGAAGLGAMARTLTPACRCVLTFDGALTAERRAALEDAGVEITGYLTDGAYVARLGRADARKLAGLGFVVGHARFAAEWKIEQGIGERAYETPERVRLREEGRAQVAVYLFADATVDEVLGVSAEILGFGGSDVFHQSESGGLVVLAAMMRRADIGRLAAHPAVQYIEDAPEFTDRNSVVRAYVQSNMAGVTPVYDRGLRGEGQLLGLIDSGLDPSHCSFSDTEPFGPTHRKIEAYNTVFPIVTQHGTHVAGTLAGDNGVSDNTRGVAHAARFVFSVRPAFTEAAFLEWFELHHSQGARIHSNSWGNDLTTHYDGAARAIDVFSREHEDDLVLFAVSNLFTLRNPENAKNALAVGAAARPPNQANHCMGGIGPTADGRRKPEIYAPGCSTLSSRSSTACLTISQSGTSMATPAIAGCAALVRQYFMEGFYPSGMATPGDAMTPSGALLKATLISATEDMTGVPDYPSNREGWGRIRLDDALYFDGDARRLFVRDVRHDSGLTTGAVVEQGLLVASSDEPLQVTLVWMDQPGAPGAVNPVVNDLDLEVIAPDMTVYKGNVFAEGESEAGGAKDAINNVERVLVLVPDPGVWTVRVIGAGVNVGTQGFALAATGDLSGEPAGVTVVALDAPSVVLPGNAPAFTVLIDPGDDSIVGGSELLHYRLGPGGFTAAALSPIGGNLYTASLPVLLCEDEPEFYVEAEGMASGVRRAPIDAPSHVMSMYVGEVESALIFEETFEGGLPAGWAVSGLWHVTGACEVMPSCGGSQWAYYGQDMTCNYNTGTTNAGTMMSESIMLPSGSAYTLEYCTVLTTENFPGVDEASVWINGQLVELTVVEVEGVWETRTVDLSAFAGQSITIEWRFDTVDSFANAFHGWQVDNVRVYQSVVSCTPPPGCDGDADGNNTVDIDDITFIVLRLGEMGGPADVDGSGVVDIDDITYVVLRLGPC